MRRTYGQMLVAALLAGGIALPAAAQQMKRPIELGAGGLGMSTAGKQAILNEQLRGETPDNLLKGPQGRLLEVREGGDGTAFVVEAAAPFLPGRRTFGLGGGLRGDGAGGSGIGVVLPGSTGAAVAGWTRQVYAAAGAMPLAAGGSSSIDQWTALVYGLRPLAP